MKTNVNNDIRYASNNSNDDTATAAAIVLLSALSNTNTSIYPAYSSSILTIKTISQQQINGGVGQTKYVLQIFA
jgi:hypothetical protein